MPATEVSLTAVIMIVPLLEPVPSRLPLFCRISTRTDEYVFTSSVGSENRAFVPLGGSGRLADAQLSGPSPSAIMLDPW